MRKFFLIVLSFGMVRLGICFAQEAASLKKTPTNFESLASLSAEERKALLEEEKKEFELAVKKSQKIKKGVTTEKEILEWFGQPVHGLDDTTLLYGVDPSYTPQNCFPETYASYVYPAPNNNQKVIGYIYVCSESYKIRRKVLLITLNKETGIVEHFKSFEKVIQLELDI